MKEKIINIAANRVSLMNGPTPMDIGNTNIMNQFQQFQQFQERQAHRGHDHQAGKEPFLFTIGASRQFREQIAKVPRRFRDNSANTLVMGLRSRAMALAFMVFSVTIEPCASGKSVCLSGCPSSSNRQSKHQRFLMLLLFLMFSIVLRFLMCFKLIFVLFRFFMTFNVFLNCVCFMCFPFFKFS